MPLRGLALQTPGLLLVGAIGLLLSFSPVVLDGIYGFSALAIGLVSAGVAAVSAHADSATGRFLANPLIHPLQARRAVAPVSASTVDSAALNRPIAVATSPVTASDAWSTTRISTHATDTDATVVNSAAGTSTSAARMIAPGSPAASDRRIARKNSASTNTIDMPSTVRRIGVSAGKNPPSKSTLVVAFMAETIDEVIDEAILVQGRLERVIPDAWKRRKLDKPPR